MDKLILPTTVSQQKVPLVFQEPHIKHGYRVPDKPWRYYLLSLFQIHNECVNVWTHLIALFITVYKLFVNCQNLDFIHDSYTWPYLCGCLTCVLLYVFSSGAHLLHSKSALIHYTCFMFDYAGIGLYGLGCGIQHFYYSSQEKFYEKFKNIFVPVCALLSFLSCASCTVGKVHYRRPYPPIRKHLQMVSVSVLYLWIILPLTVRFIDCYIYNVECDPSIPVHLKQVLWFISCAFFFSSNIPQRLSPGLCDCFGHSHQLFHVTIMMTTINQMDAVLMDLRSNSTQLAKQLQPTFFEAFGPVILVGLLELSMIIFFREIARHKEE